MKESGRGGMRDEKKQCGRERKEGDGKQNEKQQQINGRKRKRECNSGGESSPHFKVLNFTDFKRVLHRHS